MEWSPLALDRIADSARSIAKDNPDAAVRWVNELFESVDRLADFPESGRVVPEVGVQRIRELIFGAYRVIYSVKDKVEILAEVMIDGSPEGSRMDCSPARGIPRQRSDSASDECIRS